ncbi:ABC transporter permease [Prosthecomicrobium pneumaticum]|uniref:Putative spermidine/putrescine transport system permease protein n=1 Tax=Prosthecomicrobium pneumaticum TaxID=81895 RepID=A0A7W9FNJ7_9HYPH|nr:ABC transporter permease [Prosthecomicrobium pneumaticum]MBB5753958.1 putative spermidine/putrescine transport system permease protein [Prosthecomicrobium pneumaticum]
MRRRGVSISEAFGGFRLWWLVLPAFLFFLAFFVVPVLSLLAISFNKTVPGVVTLTDAFTLDNFVRIFTRPLYYEAILRSIGLGVVVAAVALVLGYPLAFLIAKTEHPGRNTALMILVLASMQLDMVIRMYGLMVLMGDTGLINSALIGLHLIDEPLPLMYNAFGVVVGLVQVTLPFMVLSLVGIIRAIHPSLEEAARSLGASRGEAFRRVVLPLSMPGILAGSLLVFALSISSYVVPALMGGWKVVVLPIHIYQQIAEAGRWQFGAAVAAILFLTSLVAVFVYHRAAVLTSGGRT